MDVDAGADIAAAGRAGLELQQAAIERDGVVVADRPLILEAADALQVDRGGLPRGIRMRRRLSEARIVAWEEAIDHALGVGEGAGLREPQFGDEAILEGAEEAFDAALALWGRGRDPADAQLVEGAADLGGGNGARQFVGQGLRGAGIAMKQAMAIGVGGSGDTIALDEAAEEQEVAVGILLEAKDRGEDLPGGVIDGGEEDEPGTAVFQPEMVAPVHLDEEAGLGHALAATPMAGRATRARTAEAGGAQQTLDRFAGHAHALAFRQQVGELVIVHAGVGGTGQRQDPSPDGLRRSARRRPAAVAVGQGSRAMRSKAASEPPDLAR